MPESILTDHEIAILTQAGLQSGRADAELFRFLLPGAPAPAWMPRLSPDWVCNEEEIRPAYLEVLAESARQGWEEYFAAEKASGPAKKICQCAQNAEPIDPINGSWFPCDGCEQAIPATSTSVVVVRTKRAERLYCCLSCAREAVKALS